MSSDTTSTVDKNTTSETETENNKSTTVAISTQNNENKETDNTSVNNNNDNDSTKSPQANYESFNKLIKFTVSKNKKEKVFINLHIHKSFVQKLRSQEQIYFASIAPLKRDHIDVNCNAIKEVQLHYCCGLFMPVDASFTVESILSTEFISSLQKLCAMPSTPETPASPTPQTSPSPPSALLNQEQKQEPNSSPIPNSSLIDQQQADDNKSPQDTRQHIIIYVPGQQYAQDEFTAAESIMNECLHFCVSFPYVIVPFLWPSEGPLLSGDDCVEAEKHCANELATFIRRMWSVFEWIDVIGHGRGCNLLLQAMQMLSSEKREVIADSQVVFIAPDMESKQFIKYVQTLRDTVKRMTLYVNTWDWKLYSSKWWNWSSDRAGASIIIEKGLDTIDTTDLLSEWFTSNHFYLTNEHFLKDISQVLSKLGGVEPKERKYLLPMAQSSFFSFTVSPNSTYYSLTDTPLKKAKSHQNKEKKNSAQIKDNNKSDVNNANNINKNTDTNIDTNNPNNNNSNPMHLI